MRAHRIALFCAVALAASGATAAAQPCLVVADARSEPRVASPEQGVRQVISLTTVGEQRTAAVALLYLKIERLGAGGGVLGSWHRLMDKRSVKDEYPFTFDGAARYRLGLYRASTFLWPAPPTFDDPVAACAAQTIEVGAARGRPDFPGVRGQLWGGATVKPLVHLLAGGSFFAQRWGGGVSAECARAICLAPEAPETARYSVATDVRYRGARGFIGVGVRAYPQEDERWRRYHPIVVLGEELPSFRGRVPMWIQVEVRADVDPVRRLKIGRLVPSVSMRFDLPGLRP